MTSLCCDIACVRGAQNATVPTVTMCGMINFALGALNSQNFWETTQKWRKIFLRFASVKLIFAQLFLVG